MSTKLMALMYVVILSGCSARSEPGSKAPSAPPDVRLVGTWELVSTRITRGGSTLVEGTAPEIRALKILNATHYSVVTRRGDQFLRAGTGRYTLVGNTYTESVDLASSTPFTPGAVYTFNIRLDGNLWTLDGGSDLNRVEEVWRRVQ